MALSEFIKNNENYLRNALREGIDAETINLTIENILANIKGKVPNQLGKLIENLADMKNINKNTLDNNYNSSIIKSRNTALKSVLRDGISKQEIADSIKRNIDNKNLIFSIRTITGLSKNQTLIKERKNKVSYQKIKL